VATIVITKFMERITYKPRHIRLADKTWELFKNKRLKSGLSCNQYILLLLQKNPSKPSQGVNLLADNKT
jgi:hypothetical protein